MDSPLHLKTDQDGDEYASRFDGVPVGRARDQLDALSFELGVRPLTDFVTITDEDLDDYFDEEEMGVDHDLVDDAHDENRVWFQAADGISSVGPLIEFLEAEDDGIDDQEEVLAQLRALHRCLVDVKKRGIHWHFALDR